MPKLSPESKKFSRLSSEKQRILLYLVPDLQRMMNKMEVLLDFFQQEELRRQRKLL